MSDRKYRQHGYQDSGTESGRGKRDRAPRQERLEGAPRGRTAGGFGPAAFKCARCGALRKSLGEIEVEMTDTCLDCGADLHTCTNCKSFDSSVQWACRDERITERVTKKDVRNECSFFEPKIVKDLSADKSRMQSPDDARKAFEDLFKS